MLSYDYTTSLAAGCPDGGLSELEWSTHRKLAHDAREQLRVSYANDSGTYLHMPELACEQLTKLATQVRDTFEHLVVVGIGGSSLGTRAAWEAMTRPYSFTMRDGSARDGVQLHFVENIDPVGIGDLLDTFDLKNTAFNIVTKSGSTIETMSSFFVIRERLIREFGDDGYRQRVYVTTDPRAGTLRAVSEDEGLQTLSVPPGVGGRFSVLSAVGLFPLAAAGLDVGKLLAGARFARETALTTERLCPAGTFAAVQVALYNKGRTDVVFMPYVNRMSSTSDWFVQLWAESLGKTRANGERVGPSPFPALGVRDQHSILQLMMEGPQNKNTVFVVETHPPADVSVPAAPERARSLQHLANRPIVDALHAEQRGVAAGLREAGHPTSEFRMAQMNEETFGALIMTLEMATALAGIMLQINPFDQPGVELGKLYAHGVLGREGLEEYRERLESWEAQQQRHEARIVKD